MTKPEQVPLAEVANRLGWQPEPVDKKAEQCLNSEHEQELDMTAKKTAPAKAKSAPKTMAEHVDELKTRVLTSALKRHKGCVRQVALELDVNRGGLYRTLERLGIDCEDFRPE